MSFNILFKIAQKLRGVCLSRELGSIEARRKNGDILNPRKDGGGG